jgi:hypothetical protein
MEDDEGIWFRFYILYSLNILTCVTRYLTWCRVDASDVLEGSPIGHGI